MVSFVMSEFSIGAYFHAWMASLIFISLVTTYLLLRYFHGKFRVGTGMKSIQEALTTLSKKSVAVAPLEFFQQYKGFDREIQDVRVPFDAIPKFTKIIYNVGVLGVAGSGKTALCLKLTNDLIDMEKIPQTVKAQYERTVSVINNETNNRRTAHAIRFLEWGGEFLVRAQSDIIMMNQGVRHDGWEDTTHNCRVMPGLQALVFVVDIATSAFEAGGRGESIFNINRIRQQVEQYFTPAAISFILNESIAAQLYSVLLFVNKADCFDGSQEELEEKVRSDYFGPLMQAMRHRFPDTRVIIGSALSGLGLNTLMAALALNILPKDAHDSGGSPYEPTQEMLESVAVSSAPALSTDDKFKT